MNRYCIKEQIGAGTFGTVYRATKIATGQEVSVRFRYLITAFLVALSLVRDGTEEVLVLRIDFTRILLYSLTNLILYSYLCMYSFVSSPLNVFVARWIGAPLRPCANCKP
jgi:serine/threonine protein kinase